jgi:oxygen-independent coproporphyrinogen-3 oxidase
MDMALSFLKTFGNNRSLKNFVLERMKSKIFTELQDSFYNKMVKADYENGFSFPVSSKEVLLYIHIPFCSSLCKNCKFTRTTDLTLIEPYVDALIKDLETRLAGCDLKDKRIRACYFGGGTPSLLPPKTLERIIKVLKKSYPFDTDSQITIEASPDSLTPDFIAACKEMLISRISIGGQSFNQNVLSQMNRTHSAGKLEKAIKLVQDAGINFNIDFLYGWPSQTVENFIDDVKKGIDLGIPHFAFYNLTPGLPGKEFGRKKNLIKQMKKMYDSGREYLLSHDYKQYTFEHFTTGVKCLYSSGICLYPTPDVVSFGPGTYGWTGNLGYIIKSTVIEYIESIKNNSVPLYYFEASEEHRLINRLFLSLCLFDVDLSGFKGDLEKYKDCKRLIGLMEYLDLIKIKNNRLIVNEEYYFTISAMMSDMVFNVVL